MKNIPFKNPEYKKLKCLLLLILIGFGCEKRPKPPISGTKSVGDESALQEIVNGKKIVSTNISWYGKIKLADLGLAPVPTIEGLSLAQIVSSQVVVRSDGKLCSACHNRSNAMGGYGVDSNADVMIEDLLPTDQVSGRSWAGNDGWAQRFVKNGTKPLVLRALFRIWMQNKYATGSAD